MAESDCCQCPPSAAAVADHPGSSGMVVTAGGPEGR